MSYEAAGIGAGSERVFTAMRHDFFMFLEEIAEFLS